MRWIILMLLIVTSCGKEEKSERSQPIRDSESIAQSLMLEDAQRLRGYSEINDYIKSNIVMSESFDIGHYLEEDAKGFEKVFGGTRLADNLGSSKSNGMRTTENGTEPNAMSMLLWNIVIESFSTDITRTCRGEKPILEMEFFDEFSEILSSFCRDENTDPTFEPMYEYVLGYYGTPAHQQLWSEFQSEYYADEENDKPVHNLFYTLMYSPEFLVRR